MFCMLTVTLDLGLTSHPNDGVHCALVGARSLIPNTYKYFGSFVARDLWNWIPLSNYCIMIMILIICVNVKGLQRANRNKEPDPVDRVPHPQTPYRDRTEWYLVAKFMLLNKGIATWRTNLFTSMIEKSLKRHTRELTSRRRKLTFDVTFYKMAGALSTRLETILQEMLARGPFEKVSRVWLHSLAR